MHQRFTFHSTKLTSHLLASGWSPDRWVDAAQFTDVLRDASHDVTPLAADVLSSFGGLAIAPVPSDGQAFEPEPLWFDTTQFRWSRRPHRHEAAVGEALTPIGSYGEFQLFVTGTSRFYLAWDMLFFFAGAGLEQALLNMVFAEENFTRVTY